MRIKSKGGCGRGFGQPSVAIMIRTTAGRDGMADSTLRYRQTPRGRPPARLAAGRSGLDCPKSLAGWQARRQG